MSKWQLFWAMVALAATPLFAETTTDDYTFRYSTLDRVGELAVRPTSETTGLSFTLSAETFDKAIKLGTEWRPVAFVPPKVTVTAISVAIPGTDAPAFITVTPSVAEGEVRFDLDDDAAPETVSLVGADGIAHTATLRTYENTTGVLLTPDKACAFRFDDAQTGTAIRNFYTIDGDPHLRVTGTASITRHVITISNGEQYSLDRYIYDESQAAGDYVDVDVAGHVLVVEFSGKGGSFELNGALQKAPLVIGSSVPADQAAVNFHNDFRVPLSLRDGEAGQGGVSLAFSLLDETGPAFNPSELLLDCDVTLKSPVRVSKGSWLATHAVPIPAGRTFRLELASPVDSEDNLPNLSFADATSRLELASNAIGTDGNPLGIPAKYLTLVKSQSGTLVLNRDVTVPEVPLMQSPTLFIANEPDLDFTLVLAGEHIFTFNAPFQIDDYDGVLPGYPDDGFYRSFTLIQEKEVKQSSFGKGLILSALGSNTLRVEGGSLAVDGSVGDLPASSITSVSVAKDATLTLNNGLAKGTDSTAGVFNLTVAGTLNLTGDVYMTPAARRTLRLEGGTIHANANSGLEIVCADVGALTAEDYLVVSGGGVLEGPMTVDNVTGGDTLTIGEGTTVSNLYAYDGTIEGTGDVDAFTGDLGDVTLGGDWLTGPGKSLAEVVDKAQNYHGTLGFTAGTADAPKVIDFASVAKLTELPGAFRAANYQHVTMRLDQYIDATIRWPDDPQGITLTLIESGAYGGEAEIPAVPAGVTFEFKYYDAAGGLVEREEGDDYQREPSEDGVNDELTWENAVFTGQGAWIDVEFDGTSANSGWFNLGEQKNGCLVGVDGQPDYGKVTENASFFVAMGHPVSKGMTLGYRPYVAESALPSFPEEWSLAVRMTAPSAENKCILAIGNNYANATASTYSLVFATGAVKEDGTTEIVLWKFDGYADGAAQPAQDLPEKAIHELFRVKVADAQSAPHVFSVVCDGATLNLYMDGAWLNAIDVPAQTTLSGGLQLGQQLGGSRVSASARSLADDVAVIDGGAVDYIRFYKGAFPETAMVEMADRTPYVRENLRYVRYVPLMTMPDPELGDYEKPAKQPENETWIQKDAWLEQTWDGTKWVNKALVDQPAEGAECRILVAEGEHALQVNVERQVEAKAADGNVTNAGRYFYSPNRTYASLVVRAQDAADSAATLRLVPLGVTEKETADTMNARPWETQLLESDWFKVPEKSSPGNRTGFRYGTLRFTGGAEDPITSDPAIKNFHGAGYLIDAASVGVDGIFDAGVCYLSKYAQVVLQANADNASLQSTLEMVAGMSLTRGMVDEVARWQLTGPVVVPRTTTLDDHVLGHAGLPKDQASEDVWVPFFGADSTWKFYDDTRVEGGTDNANNANGAKSGLFARAVRATGRLYLDFTATNGQAKYKADPNFSKQAWYRYNYEGAPEPGATGKTAEEANADDFAQAVAFQIRLSSKADKIVTLTLDKVPDADVQTFYVEEAAGTEDGPLTLALETADNASPLTVWQRVVAAARLDVSNHGKGNALNLRPEGPTSARRTPIHRGNSTRGAYVVGNATGDWDFGAESSVPRLEVAKDCELTFTVGQDLRRYGTVVAAQEGAWIHHVSDAPFLGQDVELGAGSTLGFHAVSAADADTAREEGLVLAGRLVLHGTATLRAEGGSGNRLPRFFAAGGIVAEPLTSAESEAGQTGGIELIVHADKGAAWRSRTAALTGTGFGLRKTGPGVVTFDTDVPPSVSGKVTVEEGTLNVTAAAATPVGSAGLEVREGATLGDSRRMVGEGRLLAAIPGGQTLSGGGTVDGVLRLESGATYVATQGEHLTVTGGLSVGDGGTADINVTLPTGATEGGTTEGGAAYVGDTPYLVSWREERTIRRRFEPTLGGARWDAIAWLEGGRTFYAAREPALPVPGDLDEGNQTANVWHPGFAPLMVNQYQSLGHAYVGATQGRTRAGSARLSASQINDALYAFSGISAFAPSAGAATGDRTYIDAHNFFVAYEFGISRMAFATIDGAKHVVVEVKVRNALAESFGEAVAAAAAEGAAAFRTKTVITLQAVKDGTVEALPSDDIKVTEVANLEGARLTDSAARAADVRYFALPYEALKKYFDDAPILLRPRAVNNEVELPAQQ